MYEKHLAIQSVFNTQHLIQFSSVAQSCPILLTLWTAAHQASLSITNSRSLLKLMFIKSVMPSNHLILCRPLLLLPSIFTSIRAFSNVPRNSIHTEDQHPDQGTASIPRTSTHTENQHPDQGPAPIPRTSTHTEDQHP